MELGVDTGFFCVDALAVAVLNTTLNVGLIGVELFLERVELKLETGKVAVDRLTLFSENG